MYGVNKVILVGTIGKENKVTDFTNGGKIVTNSLATTKKGFKTKDGREVKDRTDWHNIVFRDGLAKLAEQFIKVGTNLYIEGELRTRSYDGNNGQKIYTTEVHVLEMHLLPSAKKKDDQSNNSTANNSQAPAEQKNSSPDNSQEQDAFAEADEQRLSNIKNHFEDKFGW